MQTLNTLLKAKPQLLQIAVRGFKRHVERTELQLSRVNFLLGPNNAGKTSFFEALQVAQWMSSHKALGGTTQSDFKQELGIDANASNHNSSAIKATDYTVTAQVAVGDSFCEAQMVATDTRVMTWKLETDDGIMTIYPKPDASEWVYLPLKSEEGARLSHDWEDDLFLAALRSLGLEIDPWAAHRLEPFSGPGEIGDAVLMGNAINLHSEGFSVPSYLRGVVGFKNGFYLVRGGQNVFWLIDERGRRVPNPDWFQFFGLHKDDMTKGQFLSMFTLLGAVEGLEARLNGIVHGTMESRMGGQSLGGVLSSMSATWQSKVIDSNLFDDVSGWFNPYVPNSDYDYLNSRGGVHVPGTLLHWLRSQFVGFPWSESLERRNSGSLRLPQVESGLLDFTEHFVGIEDEDSIWLALERAENASRESQIQEWLSGLEELGVDTSGEVESEDQQPVRVHEGAMRKHDDEIVKDIYAQGVPDHEFDKGTAQETSARHLDGLARKPPSKAQSYGFPRGRVDSPLLYSFSRELEESAAFSEANQEGQLSKLWEVESWLMSQPFSFQLLRLEPDVTPFKGSYSDASEFPYPNVWEAFLSVQERRSDRPLRKEIMAAQAVLSCSLDYLGISRSLKMRWKPYLKRLELDLQLPAESPSTESLEAMFEGFSQRRKEEVRIDAHRTQGAPVSRVSHWGEVDRQYRSEDELRQEDRRNGLGRVESLGRGSQLVLHSLLALFDASLRTQPTLVVLEEPSAFLHPSMASKFAEVLRFAAEKFVVQVVVETHNEYMIRQLQTARIKGESLSDVSIHYFDGETGDVTRMNVEESGRIDPPIPEGFLDKSQTMMREQSSIKMAARKAEKNQGKKGE